MPTSTLHIFHTNDFHGKLTNTGSDTLRAAIATVGDKPYLLLDAGDAVKAGNIEANPFGEPILRRMGELGYAAMAMGNREFHVFEPMLAAKIKDASFPVLCANIRRKDGDSNAELLPVVPFIRLNIGDWRIGIFGLTVPMVTTKMTARHLSHFLFDDPIATAQRLVSELRDDCDLRIALTHIGIKEDERLAQSVPGLDLIIGGHTHVVLESPLVVNSTPIVQGGSHGRYYGQLSLTKDTDGKITVTGGLHPLEAHS